MSQAVPPFIFTDWLKAQAAAAPERLALAAWEGAQDTVRRWTYAALDEQVELAAGRLAGLGLQPGDFLATHLGASPEHAILAHAAARLGLALAPLNTRLTPGELRPQLERLDCRVCIGALGEKRQALAAPGLKLLDWPEFTDIPLSPFNPPAFELARLQGVVFTSGTAGASKAVQLTFANHFWSAAGSAARLGMLPSDRWLSPLPLYHVGGLTNLFRCALAGCALYLCPPDAQALQAVLSQDATLVSLVPTILARLLNQPGLDFPNLRLVLLGGAAAAPELLREAASRGLRVAVTYGLTEACSQVATSDVLPGSALNSALGGAGRPLMHTRLRIVDEQGVDLAVNQIGEVLVSGPTVTSGYFGDPAATQKAIREGWLHTGDLGYLDENGCLYLVQRRSDLIISGGENIYPSEVEQALCRHPAVAEACVIGVPDGEWGQRVAGLVVLRLGNSVDEYELVAFLRRSLAAYKLPRLLRFVTELPQTASGKVSRRMAQALLEAEERKPDA